MTTLLNSLSGNVPEISHDNNGSQDVSALDAEMEGLVADPFAMPVSTCGLAGGLQCTLPLDGSVKSIRRHLRLHGHRYPQRQAVQCPWMGCSDTLLWMNIPRHIRTFHLGVRFECANCGKPFTRPQGLARHIASLKCNG